MADALTQIVDKVKDSSNILVTVNTNPSVDELSAALGITLFINKLGKHATAVFSGKAPHAIEFLNPEKTFENTVDSLRDFIIALDKEKADHLRYKVVDDMVKIFITPYRTTINEKDLDFSQGDYNVEAVLAIGVQSEADLDHALESHGRILHDATVATVSLGEATKLGGIEWNNPRSSSYSELLYQLAEKLSDGKNVIDEQIATAFLTGIVSATERFSNDKTSSAVMTVAASLMAAGANQQLIAVKLQEGSAADDSPESSDDAVENASVKVSDIKDEAGKDSKKESKDDDAIGSLAISHEPKGDVDAVKGVVDKKRSADALNAAEDQLAKHTNELSEKRQKDAAELAEQKLAEQLASAADSSTVDLPAPVTPSVADIQRDIARASETLDAAAAEPVTGNEPIKMQLPTVVEPSIGGTLNATTEQAAEDARKIAQDDRNKVILSHDSGSYTASAPATQAPLNATAAHVDEEPKVADVFAESAKSAPTNRAAMIQPPAPVAAPAEPPAAQDDALAAVQAALETDSAAGTAEPSGDLPPLPPLPPMPDFSTLPPLTTDGGPVIPDTTLEAALPPAPAPAPAQSDPAQFKIPGQQ